MPRKEHGRIVATADEARAAVTGTGLSSMLVWSMAAVIVLMVLVAIYFFG